MKTLTFEKLIEKHDEDFYKENGYYLSKTEPEIFALELMKQVRLATLEECVNKVSTSDSCKVWNCEGESINKHSILDLDKNSIEIN